MLSNDDERDDGAVVKSQVARTALALHLRTKRNGDPVGRVKKKKKDGSRTTSAGLWTLGEEFFLTVNYIPEGKRGLSDPCYSLLSHSIELTLKAFLRAKGYTVKEWEYRKRGFKAYPIIDDLYSFERALLDGTRGECTGRKVRVTIR
jgi:hypothetical protein